MEKRVNVEVEKKVVELRHNRVRYEEIAEQLGMKLKTVHKICQRNKCLYSDIEGVWKIEVEGLRRSGYDYTEIAERLNVDREDVEHYCQIHALAYKDLGDESRHMHVAGGWNKGKIIADFEKNVEKKYAGEFELVSVGEVYGDGVRKLTIRCKTCGTEKAVSSITLRGKGTRRCIVCHPREYSNGGRKSSKETAVNKEIKRRQLRLAEEKKKVKKKLKKNQVGLVLCKCGQTFLLSPQKVCDECKREASRARENRKETKRRMNAESAGDFDKTITIEGLIIRDHNTCYLCGGECDSNDFKRVNGVFVAGFKYPTIEHVIPLAKGGTHTWDNVKLAHWYCNTKKGAKLLAG
jgi:5-methylcytosine-specific restriction endonuclease McrA/DNA-binding CsgD family transcriptional regulator